MVFWLAANVLAGPDSRLRLLVETDAGGDPDDEQSLVRLLVYANEFDIEGIIANRPTARERENLNPVRDGLGIVRALVDAYGQCQPNLARHDPRFPTAEYLRTRVVPGYDDRDDGVDLILRVLDAADERPVWFCNWGTDHGSAQSSLKRALTRALVERGQDGYAKLKSRLRLCSADKFGEHTVVVAPPFPLWVDTLGPQMDGRRWYHRFSALTATAGGFDIERDVRNGHGPLGPLYPTNTGLPQKEGDTLMFLYLLPTGMNDPNEPTWGSWAGRYGPKQEFPGKRYFGANQIDAWSGSTNRDNTLARWAVDLQNDFRARMDWCVKAPGEANHRPIVVLNGDGTGRILRFTVRPGDEVRLTADGSTDPDGDSLRCEWLLYREAGTYPGGEVTLRSASGWTTSCLVPAQKLGGDIHVILRVQDSGRPALCSYRRAVVVVTVQP